MAKEKGSKSSGGNAKVTFGNYGSKKKRTSIGNSRNSKPNNKRASIQKKVSDEKVINSNIINTRIGWTGFCWSTAR
jgi:hypothetical protein